MKILVLCRDPDLLNITSIYLRAPGRHIIACDDAAEALQMYEHSAFDVVFIEITIPFKLCIGFLHAILALGFNIPVIVISCYDDEFIRRKVSGASIGIFENYNRGSFNNTLAYVMG